MIIPKKLNAVILVVHNLEKSSAWYKKHFGFERKYEVEGGILIGNNSVEIVLSQVDELQKAQEVDMAKTPCIRLFAFEVEEKDLTLKKSFLKIRI
ncbi:MAG: VOC family protein [Planctomycetota bacterium]|jgi:catechol 2,3-dioxygenase-like lactoylglutathione lyase family enzyme